MKYCVVSDIHANWPALEAVKNDVKNSVDGYIILGDLIGLSGYPDEVVEFVMDEAEHFVKGNHDVSVIENDEGHVNSPALSKFELSTTKNALNENQISWLKSQSSYKEIPEEGLLIAHAKPYPESSSGINSSGIGKGKFTKVASKIDSDKFNFVLFGHTHEQSKLNCSDFGHDVTILNPGSVGQPISDGKAEYAVIDTETGDASLETAEYDQGEVMRKIKSLGTPIEWWSKSRSQRNGWRR